MKILIGAGLGALLATVIIWPFHKSETVKTTPTKQIEASPRPDFKVGSCFRFENRTYRITVVGSERYGLMLAAAHAGPNNFVTIAKSDLDVGPTTDCWDTMLESHLKYLKSLKGNLK